MQLILTCGWIHLRTRFLWCMPFEKPCTAVHGRVNVFIQNIYTSVQLCQFGFLKLSRIWFVSVLAAHWLLAATAELILSTHSWLPPPLLLVKSLPSFLIICLLLEGLLKFSLQLELLTAALNKMLYRDLKVSIQETTSQTIIKMFPSHHICVLWDKTK